MLLSVEAATYLIYKVKNGWDSSLSANLYSHTHEGLGFSKYTYR